MNSDENPKEQSAGAVDDKLLEGVTRLLDRKIQVEECLLNLGHSFYQATSNWFQGEVERLVMLEIGDTTRMWSAEFFQKVDATLRAITNVWPNRIQPEDVSIAKLKKFIERCVADEVQEVLEHNGIEAGQWADCSDSGEKFVSPIEVVVSLEMDNVLSRIGEVRKQWRKVVKQLAQLPEEPKNLYVRNALTQLSGIVSEPTLEVSGQITEQERDLLFVAAQSLEDDLNLVNAGHVLRRLLAGL